MADRGGSDGPLESVTDVAGAPTTELFALLADETRLAILLALWEAFEPFPEGGWDPTGGNAVSFSALRDRVGIRQGAQFNYHLDRLVGDFVAKTDDGYELLPAGNRVVRTLIAIAGLGEPPLEGARLGLHCPLCGGETAITYRDQRLFRVCTDCEGYHAVGENYPSGALLATLTTPAVLRDRTPDEVFAAVRTKIHHDYALRIAGVCPACSGRVEHRVDVCGAHEPAAGEPCRACGRSYDPAVRFVCTVCRHWNATSFTEVAMRHPAVAAFCWEHGLELGYSSPDTARWFEVHADHDQQLLARDPLRVRVTVRHDGEALDLTLDGDLDVLGVERSG